MTLDCYKQKKNANPKPLCTAINRLHSSHQSCVEPKKIRKPKIKKEKEEEIEEEK